MKQSKFELEFHTRLDVTLQHSSSFHFQSKLGLTFGIEDVITRDFVVNENMLSNNIKLNLTQHLIDYLALFFVLILSILRKKTAVTSSQAINIRMTRDVGCGTDQFDDEHDDEIMTTRTRSKIHVLTEFRENEIEQKTCDFYQNTDLFSLNDVATNTDPIIMTPSSRLFDHNLTGSPLKQGNKVKTRTPTTVFDLELDRLSGLPAELHSTVEVPQAGIAVSKFRGSSSKSTQTYSGNEINPSTSRIRRGATTCKTRSRIPVLLKNNPLITGAGIQNEHKQISQHVSNSPDLKTTTMYPGFNRSDQRHISSSSSSSSNWSRSSSNHIMDQKTIQSERDKFVVGWSDSDRYRYCDSNIKNGVMLRSPSKLQQNNFPATPRRSFAAVGIDSTATRIDSRQLKNGKRPVRKCRSFGGEKIDFVTDLSPQNFVVNPRRRYQSKSKCNRRLYKISYISGC